MKIVVAQTRKSPPAFRAFTLVDVMVGVAIVGVTFVTLYLGFTQGFAVIQLARENLRATQILQEKAETIRLYTWDQINTSGFVPTTFTAPFYAVGTQSTGGLIFNGRLTIANASLSGTTYSGDLREVTVEVDWVSGNVPRHRTMRTLVSRYGLQQYIY